MNILNDIVATKKEEIEIRKIMVPVDQVINSVHFDLPCLSMVESLSRPGASGIIAEFKRKSPSKGYINKTADVVTVTGQYAANGASGISVLTDKLYFGGSSEDLVSARVHQVPILRKDFIIDPYQILVTKAMGADVVLLIAAILSPTTVKDFAQSAHKLGMEVLLEIHDESELGHICEEVDMVGINNRNLNNFKVNITHSLALSMKLPAGKIKVAESGLDNPATIPTLRKAGFSGFLIGEAFMRENEPGQALKNFIEKIN